MRKRTNWSVDSIVGARSAVDDGQSNSHIDGDVKSDIGVDIDPNRGWSSFQSQYQKDFSADALPNPSDGPNHFNPIQNPWLRKNRRSHFNTMLLSQDAIIRIIGIVTVIGFIVLWAIYGSEMISTLAQGIDYIARSIFTAACFAIVLWGVLMAIIGKILPTKLKTVSFCFIFFMCLIGQFVPSLGSSLTDLVVALLIIILVIRLMVGL